MGFEALWQGARALYCVFEDLGVLIPHVTPDENRVSVDHNQI